MLVGDNPFNGVDHLSQERLRLRRSLGSDEIIRIISAAIDNGATGFTFSATPKMLELLHQMKNVGFPKKMGLYPVIPDVQSYSRLVSERGMLGALVAKLGGMGKASKVQSVFGGGLGLLAGNPEKLLKTYVKAEVSLIHTFAPAGTRIESVFLHEIGTDLIVSLGMTKLFETYCQTVKDSLEVVPGFVTRNFPRFTRFIRRGGFGLGDYFVLTPFNRLGFQMNPSKAECEKSLATAKGASVIAMSVLAGGFLELEEAIAYLGTLHQPVSVAVGVSSETHAAETFSRLQQLRPVLSKRGL